MISELVKNQKIDEVAAGCLIFNENKKKFLIIKKKKNQQWGFPKGRSNKGEENNLVLTARREVKEETDLDVFIEEDPVSAERVYEMDKKGMKYLKIFLARTENPEVTFKDGELDSFDWLSPKEYIDRLTSKTMKSLAEELFSKVESKKMAFDFE